MLTCYGVVPKVKDLEYPEAEPAPPIEVTIFGEKYLIELQIHRLDNITYYLARLSRIPVQIPSPTPIRPEWTTLARRIFYSLLESKYRRNLPKNSKTWIFTTSTIITEFQGLWPLRTKEEADEVCRAFNLSKDICTKIRAVWKRIQSAPRGCQLHQSSPKKVWAVAGTPTDIEALDAAPRNMKDVTVDEAAEAQRPEDKRKNTRMGRPASRPQKLNCLYCRSVLVAVGPVVDLYGRFAAAKLARLMELPSWPGIFQARIHQLFRHSSFLEGTLLLSQVVMKPFGLVAVEFGRKGALGVGSRLGGLGLMPGWWFPVESDSTAHMHSQFAKTIKAALKSTNEERAVLRARSALQRFPVLEWRSRMENMHRRSIKASRKYAGTLAAGPDIPRTTTIRYED
ncbi:Cell wall alpha-1,3-glucan synthase ags1 [Puccinia graminis f. sp. tritici]|uniref:Cell wall alpha-1,3-glucan synthase ags1 n=1 Tax=Puccinia graminis f. sp. tritici TaxID=56615 RepID=A0A5B0M5Y5_PUCGR|nr:Cell wall alpha-1,3-glucan synthase ags1 [Puccinia graminis f. sp. tritici]